MHKKPIHQTAAPTSANSVERPDSAIAERRKFPRPLPPPEVKEGSGSDSDWAMWDDSASHHAEVDINLDSPEFKNPVEPIEADKKAQH